MLITVKKGFRVPCAVRAPTLTTDKPGMPQQFLAILAFIITRLSPQARGSSSAICFEVSFEFIYVSLLILNLHQRRRHLGPHKGKPRLRRSAWRTLRKHDRLVMARPFLGGLSHLRSWKKGRRVTALTHLLLRSCLVIPSCHCAVSLPPRTELFVFQLPPRP